MPLLCDICGCPIRDDERRLDTDARLAEVIRHPLDRSGLVHSDQQACFRALARELAEMREILQEHIGDRDHFHGTREVHG